MLIAINYHYIKEHFNYKYPSIFGVTPPQFKAQLIALKKYGEFISPNALLNWAKGNKSIPKKSFIVTFDDGLKEQYELALPILQELNIPAIFFANTLNFEGKISTVHKIHFLRSEISSVELMDKLQAFIPTLANSETVDEYKEAAIEHYKYDTAESALVKYLLNLVLNYNELEVVVNELFKEYFGDNESEMSTNLYMSPENLKDLSQLGYLGSHGHNHLPVGQLNDAEKEFQIKYSQEKITELTGKKADFFSYPYGSKRASTGMDSILAEYGFSAAVTMERAVNHKVANPYLLSRFDNNDVVAGKAWKYGDSNPFEVLKQKTWYNEV